MPPQAVPAIRSASMHKFANRCWETLSVNPFACIVATAAQTQKALELLNPAAGGTIEFKKIFMPLGF